MATISSSIHPERTEPSLESPTLEAMNTVHYLLRTERLPIQREALPLFVSGRRGRERKAEMCALGLRKRFGHLGEPYPWPSFDASALPSPF